MDFVPKSVLKALDQLEKSLDEVGSMVHQEELLSTSTSQQEPLQKAKQDLSRALAINGLLVMLKRIQGEDAEEALQQFEKCRKASEKLTKESTQESKKRDISKVSAVTTTATKAVELVPGTAVAETARKATSSSSSSAAHQSNNKKKAKH